MSVKVAVRVRPFNSRQKDLNCTCVVDMKDPTTILKAYQGQEERPFTFDFSFWSFDQFQQNPDDGYLKPTGSKYADQKIVYDRIGNNILDNAFEGYHCCLFAYGQTGSGKSYSMIGYGSNKGIVPITCNQIFERIKKNKAGAETQYQVYCSMIQIYNEEIQDLTIPISQRPKGGLKVRQNKLLGVYVQGMKKNYVQSYQQIQDVMEQGTKNRTVAATQMNATSSRAHTIITIQFKQIIKQGKAKSEKISLINLVDLAGSQRQSKTGATGQRLKQAVGINQSLTNLGQVISTLADNAEGANKFVPYRNSALTRILQNALGGNSQTIMICAISPANDNYDQTLSTLRYADRAKKIQNKPVVNESAQDKMIRELKQENDRLKKLLEGQGKDPNLVVINQQDKQPDQNDEALKQIEQQRKKLEEQKRQLQQEKNKLEQEKKMQQQQNKNLEQDNKKLEQNYRNLQLKNKELEQNYRKQEQIKKQEESKKKENEGQKGKKEQSQLDDDQKQLTNEQLYKKWQADIKQLQLALGQEMLSKKQKQLHAEKERKLKQEQEKQIHEGIARIFGEKTFKEMQKKGDTPPYFENISRDFTLHRKLRILIEKDRMTVGKLGSNPPNDIVFGGRDMKTNHAILRKVDKKVFLSPVHQFSHLYVNGKQVTKPIELMHLDRVIFGWNSVYLFKNKDDKRTDETIKDKAINWQFCRKQVFEYVDIDQSDDQNGGGNSCCEIY